MRFLFGFLFLVLHAVLALATYRDAKERELDPIPWVFAVFFYGFLAWLIFMVVRSQEPTDASGGGTPVFDKPRLRKNWKLAAVLAGCGLFLVLLAPIVRALGLSAEEFVRGFAGTGWTLVAIAAIWWGIALLIEHTKIFSTQGRLNCLKFAMIALPLWVVLSVTSNLLTLMLEKSVPQQHMLLFSLVAIVPCQVITIFLIIRRLHDLDRPGSHTWQLLIPLYGVFVSLQLFFKSGTDGANRFGPDPLRVGVGRG